MNHRADLDHRMENHLRYCATQGGTGDLIVTNASYGSGGGGAGIGYTIVDSAFGRILIGATARGVCWLGIHESDSHLESELRRDYPEAKIQRDDAGTDEVAQRITAFIAGTTPELNLPVDIRATPFQLAVWRELCAIAPGTTRSYAEIARRIGRPQTSRAVGHANGANPIAVLIPCHRAIASNGALTGYRWGLEYKRRLLEHESTLAQGSLLLPSAAK
jgi:AraC family transcriptional regulator, regulatory protein of adaptative response / methylated-DNA-[protein]-cysteine methyltransferase